MRATLLGFTLPDQYMDAILDADPAMPIQTHTFAWALVKALQSAEIEVTLLSSAPVSNYPRYPQLRFRSEAFTSCGVQGETLGFLNVLILKHLTRFATCLGRGTRAISRWRPDVLIIHGVHTPFLLYGVLGRWLTGVKSVAIITDPPGVALPSDGVLVSALRKIDVRLVKYALRSFDGVIVLAAPLARDFAPNRPSLVMEGILAVETHPRSPRRPTPPFRALYAGGLSEPYGVGRLVEAIQSLPSESIRLATFGRGPLRSWIDSQADIDIRIQKVKFAKRQAILEEYAAADLLIQPRPVGQDFVHYSFPSKLLEYMASGTPVLTTRLPSIPPDYEPYVYWIDDDTVQGMARSLRALLAVPADERMAKGRAAAEFVFETRSGSAQGARIRDFLAEILHN